MIMSRSYYSTDGAPLSKVTVLYVHYLDHLQNAPEVGRPPSQNLPGSENRDRGEVDFHALCAQEGQSSVQGFSDSSCFMIAMRRLTTGTRSEKCIVRHCPRCADTIRCTYPNPDGPAYRAPGTWPWGTAPRPQATACTARHCTTQGEVKSRTGGNDAAGSGARHGAAAGGRLTSRSAQEACSLRQRRDVRLSDIGVSHRRRVPCVIVLHFCTPGSRASSPASPQTRERRVSPRRCSGREVLR